MQFWWVLAGLAGAASPPTSASTAGSRARPPRSRTPSAAPPRPRPAKCRCRRRRAATPPACAGRTSPRPPSAVASSSRSRASTRRRASPSAGAPAAQTVSADDTLSGETGINLDQGDPLAEADFHMAYGLYDQAADLVRLAMAREPERRDLKLKLPRCSSSGATGTIPASRRASCTSRSASRPPGEWEKIVIMGKQIAPEDPLFAGASARGAAGGAGLDLQLEGGAQPHRFRRVRRRQRLDADDRIGRRLGPRPRRRCGATSRPSSARPARRRWWRCRRPTRRRCWSRRAAAPRARWRRSSATRRPRSHRARRRPRRFPRHELPARPNPPKRRRSSSRAARRRQPDDPRQARRGAAPERLGGRPDRRAGDRRPGPRPRRPRAARRPRRAERLGTRARAGVGSRLADAPTMLASFDETPSA